MPAVFYAHVHNFSPNLGRFKMASRTRLPPLNFHVGSKVAHGGARLQENKVY